jgi:hypothetical protein
MPKLCDVSRCRLPYCDRSEPGVYSASDGFEGSW